MPQILRRESDRVREEVLNNNATSLIRQVEAEVVLDRVKRRKKSGNLILDTTTIKRSKNLAQDKF